MSYSGRRPTPADGIDRDQWRVAADYLKEHWQPEPAGTPVYMTFCPFSVDVQFVIPYLPHYQVHYQRDGFAYLTARQLELLRDLDIDLFRPDYPDAASNGTVERLQLVNYP